MEPQAQLQIADFQKDSKFTVKAVAGYSYEHLDIQFGPKGAAPLKAAYVRQALITGDQPPADRSGALRDDRSRPADAPEQHLQDLRGRVPVKHYAKYPFSQAKVISLLKGKGCTGGPDRASAGNDKIFSCPGVGKLSFRFSTTAGNQLRGLTFEVIQRQLKSVGIELVPRFEPAGPAVRYPRCRRATGTSSCSRGSRPLSSQDHGEGQARLRW